MALKNIYTVNWSKLAIWNIPVPLRLPKTLAFVTALVSCINSVYNSFISHANYVDYWLGINSQVCFMEKALNDKYDFDSRGIYIEDAVEYDPLLLFLKIENKPLVLYCKSEEIEQALYTKAETAQFTVDFIVFVPGIRRASEYVEIAAFVESIKLPSKTFKIQRV